VRDYELVFLVRPGGPDADPDQVSERVQNWITSDGGEIEKVLPWGRRRLAYVIDGQRDAHYYQINFRAGPQAIRGLERNLRISEDVIRYLTVRPGE